MLINNIDLSSLGAQLYDRILTSNKIETTQDWLEGDIQPTFIRQQDKFKSMILKFLITEKDENAAFMLMSRLTAILKKASIVFDDIDLIFDVVTNGETLQERLKNGNFILTVPLLSDYAKGKTEVYTTDARATDNFQLNILYYQDTNTLIGSKKVLIKASQFNGVNDTFESLGVNLNEHRPDYYNDGVVTNFTGRQLNYDNLYSIQTLIVNYTPVVYSKQVEYFIDVDGVKSSVLITDVKFTKAQIDNTSSIGRIVDLTLNKPNGYRAYTNFDEELTFNNFINFSPLQVYYEQLVNERTKELTINYYQENDIIASQTVIVKEGDIVDGKTLRDIINVEGYKPEKYYENGICEELDLDEIIDFDSLDNEYQITYKLSENLILVEYYLGEYPNWSRITTATYKVKYDPDYDAAEDIIAAVGINVNRYSTATYETGVVYNRNLITDFDSLLNTGIIQVYYKPKDYSLRVYYVQEEASNVLGYKDYTINDYMFIGNPTLGEIININEMKPEGYIFNAEESYQGEVSLNAMLAAAPLTITYTPVAQVRTKSVVIKYKQELASAYSTLNTSVITIEESEVGGGIRLKDLININRYKPDYYNDGILDGYSVNSVVLFDEIQGSYDVLYMASTFSTQVRYYTDVIENTNWIGSTALQYRIIDFTTSTTLVDLGLDINAFKPNYCGDGQVQYTGAVTFAALRNLDAIDIIYEAQEEPEDPDGINYPHRILFLQHNDMGNYESNFPTWTLNHAYINTGVTVQDMSKLTVLVDTYRVFDTEPLYNVNVEDAYLFGSITPQGSYYIKYVNNTTYKSEDLLTGVNTFNVAAGYGTPELVIEETASEGFSANTGITASTRDGYSYATLTYTNLVQSNNAPMLMPLYLFACNQNGYYRGGIAGVGIKSCRIYYDGNLIRDYVPVQFYDQIGDKVAPSNCLYDKITQTFFEDARGLNSFNIIDDPDYIDNDPSHMIGHCYVNYYRDNVLFNTATIYFRGSDFVDQEFNVYDKFFVDYYQPQYFGTGTITNLASIGDITFNNINNQVFTVEYKSVGYNITVNYWKDNKDNEENLIASELISLTEKDFAQVPTFGQLIDIQKYKPDNYKANYTYPESKVTLSRVLQHAPYDIIYTEVENPQIYEFKVTYLRRKYGVNILNPETIYENLGSITVQLDETEFADGVYIDKFIDFNGMYPASPIEGKPFYHSGQPFEWYLEDEMITTPEDLKAEYKVSYEPVTQYVEIRYYTDEVDEENLIASTTWAVQINNWQDEEQFQVVDELPNKYIDKYKPVICGGGRLALPDQWYTFTTLVNTGHIDIIYDTLEEPHDPENTMFPSKVIYFNRWNDHGKTGSDWEHTAPNIDFKYYQPEVSSENIYTPYLDLGYKPKEIGRLRMETKAYSLCNGNSVGSNASTYGYAGDSYEYFLGYYGAIENDTVVVNLGTENAASAILLAARGHDQESVSASSISPNSSGWMAVKGHGVKVSGFVYTSPLPQYYDGWPVWNLNKNAVNDGFNTESVREIFAGWRKGFYSTGGDNWEDIRTYDDYIAYKEEGFHSNASGAGVTHSLWYGLYGGENNPSPSQYNTDYWCKPQRKMSGTWLNERGQRYEAVVFNPWTVTIDAYNNFMELYDGDTSNNPEYINVRDRDNDIFTRRCVPKGTLSLFITTNPDTGKINWLPATSSTYMIMGGSNLHGLAAAVVGRNPWDDNFNSTVTYQTTVITGTMEDGTPIYELQNRNYDIAHAHNMFGVFNSPMRCMIWYVKIWDRDKLVRHLIPVAEGDQIYDFIAPANGMFDIVTETFYGNQNEGGTYYFTSGHNRSIASNSITVAPGEVYPLEVVDDPTLWGRIVVNYYDDKNHFLGNQYVEIPVNHNEENESIYEICHYNDFKPNEFYHDGMIDVDLDFDNPTDERLKEIYDSGAINIYYKQITFTKTVVYYQGNMRVGSKDLFYSLEDIENAETLEDLGIDADLYYTNEFKHGRIVFNEQVIADDDIKTFIDASSPIVVYDKLSKAEAPNLLYVEYYRGGAYDEENITPDPNDPNYLDCDLDAVVLNPKGTIKYQNHYHSALYEDEKQDYFIAYQVDVKANYVPVHRGPARRYNTLAIIVDKGRYTVVEERGGWGRLKEYPKGWIMLSYTEPVAGPGQHPAYDENRKALVTIPYATHITVTKMTIDRLWCYTPEHSAWIKAEEISFDQTGKLYNGLAIQVVHLDELDWNNIDSLDDMGIYPEKYKLKYHDYCGYRYNGEYTQAAFSDIHELEFMYPETIYAYNCIFYKDAKINAHAGDILVPGSLQVVLPYKQGSSYGPWSQPIYQSKNTSSTVVSSDIYCARYAGSKTFDLTLYSDKPEYVDGDVEPWYHVKYQSYEGYIRGDNFLQNVKYPQITPTDVNTEIGRESFSCSISDWNPDWATFIATSWQYDDDNNAINPTLYRDTELKLNWEFFGIDKNAYKPEGNYQDGLVLWNPRTYDNNKIIFTFEELITTGKQEIIYLPVFNEYKAVFNNGKIDIPVNSVNFTYSPGNDYPGIWDIELKYQALAGSGQHLLNAGGGTGNTQATYAYIAWLWSNALTLFNSKGSRVSSLYYYSSNGGHSDTYLLGPDYKTKTSGVYDYYQIVNWSNKRNTTNVFAWGDDLTGYKSPYYIYYRAKNEYNNEQSYTDKITDTLDVRASKYYRLAKSTNGLGIAGRITDKFTLSGGNAEYSDLYKVIWYYFKVWKNFYLEHYYIPLPKGTWLPDGRQLPYDTFYDVINNKYGTPTDDTCQIDIYELKKDHTKINNKVDYFKSWTFNTEDVQLIGKCLKANCPGYQYPNELSNQIGTYVVDHIMPIYKTTSDSENRVQGTWYFNGYAWIPARWIEIQPSDSYSITPYLDTVALKGAERNTATTYNTSKEPDSTTLYSSITFTTETITKVYAISSADKYWNGLVWIPRSYTSNKTNNEDKTYVVSTNYLNVYSYPIADDVYKVSRLQSGDKFTSNAALYRDDNWKRININGTNYWVDSYNTTQELVQ